MKKQRPVSESYFYLGLAKLWKEGKEIIVLTKRKKWVKYLMLPIKKIAPARGRIRDRVIYHYLISGFVKVEEVDGKKCVLANRDWVKFKLKPYQDILKVDIE